jgi:hypothetical protein
MPTKRNYLIKVLDAKIVDVKRALEAKGIKLDSIYEMYKEAQEPEKIAPTAGTESPTGKPPNSTTSGDISKSGPVPSDQAIKKTAPSQSTSDSIEESKTQNPVVSSSKNPSQPPNTTK